MGQEVEAAVFSREDRQRYRQKVRTCLDVFARMLRESRFDSDRRSFGLEIELNLTDEAGDPAMVERPRARGDRGRRLPDRDRPVQHRDQRAAAAARGRRVHGAGGRGPGEPQPRRRARPHGGRAHDDHRDPADGPGGAPDRRGVQRGPPLQPPERADLRGARRGPRDLDQRGGAAVDLRRHDRARGGVHERAAAPAGGPGGLREPLERRPDDRRRRRWPWARTRRSSGAASCGARRASRCSSRPPTRGPRS